MRRTGELVTRALPHLALLGLLLAPALARAEVRVDVQPDRKQLAVGERMTVRITVQTEGSGQPEVVLPDFDGFEILSQQVQRPMQFSFNFGQRAVFRSSSIYTYVLSPLRVGTLRIAPVRVQLGDDTYTTQPLDITVEPGAGGAPPAAQPGQQPGQQPDPQAPANVADGVEFDSTAFLRTVVDQAQPYVGQQVTATVYLYSRNRIRSIPTPEQEPTTDGFWTRDLLGGNTPQPRRDVVGGQSFMVYVLRRFAAFPLRDGELTIGPMSITIDNSSVFDVLTGTRRQPDIKRTGVPVTLQVQPLPEAGRPDGPIAVGAYAIGTKLDREQTATGDAVTLTAVVRGRGNIETVELPTPGVPGLDILQPQVKDLVETPRDQVSGTREYRWLLVPQKPGTFTIPPFALNTFDPTKGQYRRVVSPALSLKAVGAALPAQAKPVPLETPSAPEIDPDAVEWAPIRTQSALARRAPLLAEQPFFGWALALPPLAWLLLAGGGLLRRRLAARTVSAEEAAEREASTQLGVAEQAARAGDVGAYHAAAARAIGAQLQARLGESVASLTHDRLRAHLRARGLDDTTLSAVVEQLQGADFARFASGGNDGAALPEQARRLAALLKRLRAFSPKEEES